MSRKVCVLVEKDGNPNWCTTPGHGYHNGHYAKIAVDPGEKGIRFRRYWDEKAREEEYREKSKYGLMVAESADDLVIVEVEGSLYDSISGEKIESSGPKIRMAIPKAWIISL